MLKMIMIRSALIAFACALSVTAYAYASDPKQFDVPAGDLTAALEALAKQSGLELVYVSEQVKGLRTKGVTGSLTPEEAVTKLLDGTPLTFRKDPSGAMLIAPLKSSASESGDSEVPAARQGGAALAPGTATASASSSEKKGWFERFRVAQNDQSEGASSSSKDAQDKQSSATDSDGQLGEVIVTAQKRKQRLQDVPISMTALSGGDLDKVTDRGIADVLGRVPGVAFNEHVPSGGIQLAIRGVTAFGSANSGSSPIGYYLDSVPFNFVRTAIVPDANPYDLERVEVLRGPQGTLYGASALNGVVRILTHDADLDEFLVKARVAGSGTKEGGDNYRGDAAINVPLIEGKLGARLVAGYQDWSGWIDKPNLGKRDANGGEVRNLRLKLNAQPTEALSVGLSAWASRSDFDQQAMSGLNGPTTGSLVNEPMANDFNTYGLKIGYDFAAFSVASMTSYLDYTSDAVLDFSPFGLPNLFSHAILEAETFAQEFNLNSTHGGPWRWTLGGIYRDSTDRDISRSFGAVIPNWVDSTSESFAVFGELTRIFMEGRLELTGGLRYFEDDTGLIERSRSIGTSLVRAESQFDAVSPRLVLTWHPSDELTAYASYGEGFRSGADQLPAALRLVSTFPPVKPDTLKNYELGAKGSAWEGRLGFDAAVYYIDWEDLQQRVLVGNPLAGIPFVVGLINGESASGAGVDLGLTVHPMEGLEFGVSAGWNDLTMDADLFSRGALLIGKGERLNLSPEYLYGANADYAFPLGGSGLKARLSASANYMSQRFGFRTLSGSGATTTTVTTTGGPMLLARAGFSVERPNRWTATLFADNVTDEDRTPLGSATPDWQARVRPRTIGLQLEYHF